MKRIQPSKPTTKISEFSHVVVVVRMIKQQQNFLLTRRTEPVGVKQDLHSLQASGKSHNGHLWYVPRFELLQNRMDTKDPVPSSIGVVIPGIVRLAFWGGSVYTTPSAEPKVGVSHLGWWKGMRWGPRLLPLFEPLILSPLCDGLMARKHSISSIADCANVLRDLRRGLVFRRTKLLLTCSVSAYFKASRRVAAFRRTEAGAMPARIGKYCVGVGFRHPVIVRKAEFIATSISFVFLLLEHAGEQYSAVGYTRARLRVLSVLTEAPHPVPASRFNSAQRDKKLSAAQM